MKISDIKRELSKLSGITFMLPDGTAVPPHFHVTEVGVVSKHFIDCGGTLRKEKVANFQLWTAEDHDHRLAPEKLLDIIELSEKILDLGDLEIEVEYQSDTIGKFGLEFNGTSFLLTTTETDCLAKDKCGVPEDSSVDIDTQSDCSPNSGCC